MRVYDKFIAYTLATLIVVCPSLTFASGQWQCEVIDFQSSSDDREFAIKNLRKTFLITRNDDSELWILSKAPDFGIGEYFMPIVSESTFVFVGIEYSVIDSTLLTFSKLAIDEVWYDASFAVIGPSFHNTWFLKCSVL